MTPAAPSLAIISPWKDFWFFFASASVVLLAWFASAVLHVDGYVILATVAVVSNGPHLVATWTRVYLDAREWKARPVSIIVVPLLVFAAVFGITWRLGWDGARLLNSVILYWATWHFVAQNWGLLRIYQRKSSEPATSLALKLEKPVLLVFVLWCLLYRIETGPRVLFGTEVYYWRPPYAVTMGLLAPIAILFGVVVVERVRQRRQPWARAAWIRFAFLLMAFMGFFVPFQLITTDDTSAFAAAACWHGFQYLGIVRHYHRTAWRQGVEREARVISWLSQPGWGRAALYWALLLALAGLVYAGIFGVSLGTADLGWDFYRVAGVVWVSLTLSHYWLDGVIWKLRRPELAARVGLDVSASPAQPAGAGRGEALLLTPSRG